MTWAGVDVDVSTSVRLAAVLEAVRGVPGGWDSALGAAVDAAVVAAVPGRVGGARISSLVDRGFWSGRDEVVGELVAAVRELVMMRPVLLEVVEPDRLWPVVVRRAVWQVAAMAEGDRQRGLAGDSQPFRLRDRAGICFSAEDVSEFAGEVVGAVAGVDFDRSGWRVASEDVAGPVFGALVAVLVGAGVPEGVARGGTCRVVELAVGPGKRRERHSMARADGGVLAGLGVSQDAAGAWMSLVVGSRRAGPESALVWTLREVLAGRGADRAGPVLVGSLSVAQRRWVRTVVDGTGSPAGEQLELFSVEGVVAGVAA